MNFAAIAELASSAGAFGLAVLIIYLLMSERLIPRRRLDEKQKEVEECHDELELERARNEPRR